MLETRELCKVYKPKKGMPVTALDKVSIRFPKTGMVFLLGKSGSGKSTLLNVLGGLDKYDSGEILIKGVSSKAFKQCHFDSYRNTYVGFIFQEYNVLDEFNVGANIALAIELQNRKATDEQINAILEQVDLSGYGKRKPNELSGGQKQRVAIARALVKNPEIIMADEPTGALDSETGRQVLETLKKLSEDKLVIVVSHDREFAEQYADRIIELADGHVISDMENCDSQLQEESIVSELTYEGNTVQVPEGYHLTEEDRKAINEYISSLEGGLTLSIREKLSGKKFVPTDVSKIPEEDANGFRLIKSKLPMKNAFKIGASGLKHKKFRLVMTILLSCIAFGLFGLADTFGAYNHIKTCTNSLVDSAINYVSVTKSKRIKEDDYEYWRDYGYRLSKDEIKEISMQTGVHMTGVYRPVGMDLEFHNQINPEVELSESDFNIYRATFNGFVEVDETALKELNYKLLSGTLPDGSKDEIAVSEYIFEVFKKAGYTDGKTVTDNKGVTQTVYQTISTYEELIGKVLTIGGKKYTVSAIIDTNLDLERYAGLVEKKKHQSNADKLVDYALYNEFSYATGYNYSGLIMVGEGYVERLVQAAPPVYEMLNGNIWCYKEGGGLDIGPGYITMLSKVNKENIVWLNGEKTVLGDKELIVSEASMNFYDIPEDGFNEDGSINYVKLLGDGSIKGEMWLHGGKDAFEGDQEYKIVGVIPNTEANAVYSSCMVTSDALFHMLVDDSEGYYNFAVGTMPAEKEDVYKTVSYCYREDSDVRYQMQNSVTYELDMVNDMLKEFAKIFLYIGLGFALFAAVMLANFIGTSISYKKQEIGILRAIGSRSNDVFRIFFSESFYIAMINFVLSATGVGVVTYIINYVIRHEVGILITVLTFDIRQVALLFVVSIGVAFLASYLPVKKIASKRPIDAIRDR